MRPGVAVPALTVLLAAAFGACASDGVDVVRPATDVAIDTPAIDRTSAVAAAIDVRTQGCGPHVGFGTGSVIPNGDIVTAAHVVAGASAVTATAVDGDTVDTAVILFDPDLDLAVLRPDAPIGTPAALRSADARTDEEGLVVLPRLDGDVVAVEIAEVRVVRTTEISTTDIYLDRNVVRAGFEIEGSIDPGDSGAMVTLPGGGAGIVWARSNRNAQRAWAIDLPTGLRDGSLLAGRRAAVDVGDCLP